MAEQKKMGMLQALKLHFRAVKDMHGVDRQMFPAMLCERIITAVTPYALIYFSARILNELAGLRRVEAIRKWVLIAVLAGGLLALLRAAASRWHESRCDWMMMFLFEQKLYNAKKFEMDYADYDSQSTRDLLAQIRQNENWSGYGFLSAKWLSDDVIGSIAGIAGAAALTVSLFTSKIPQASGRFIYLNSPLFAIALLALMLLLSFLSGKLTAYVGRLNAAAADKARLGNRVFGYFGFFGGRERDSDIRIYSQQEIVNQYSLKYNAFGVGSWFDKLGKGVGGVSMSFAASFSAVFTFAVYAFTCLKALAGAFGVGSITQYVGAATTLSGNLTTLLNSLGEIRGNGKFLEDCYEFLDMPSKMYRGTLTTEKRSDRQYDVEFRDVSFRYPGSDTWALRHVNVRFKVGGRLAVVGENGSGKTTFIKLLCRLYDPQEGEILLNGIDIKKYDYHEYMDLFSIVFQDFKLLSQPLGDNVAGGNTYDKERVLKALDDAGFTDRLRDMPDGLGTLLYRDFDKKGVEISGGEAQKIAIARALYKNAPFLILDEPTAALDPMAEAEIYSRLDKITGDRTAIYISHRLSSCRFCDEILVFDHGQIVERGAHEVMVNDENGKYHALWNAQAQYYYEKQV